jgi:hypothetical protein
VKYEEAAEMTGGGQRGKPNAGFPLLPTTLGNRMAISTFPQLRLTTAMEKWKSRNRIPTFPRLIAFLKPKNTKGDIPGLIP